MKKKKIGLILLVLLFSFIKNPVAQAPAISHINPIVSTDWLASHLEDPDLRILHVAGDRNDYDAGHIPGAQYVATHEVATTRSGIPNEVPSREDLITLSQRLGLNGQTKIVLYSEDSGITAAWAYAVFDYLGFSEQTSLLDGQYQQWTKENKPTSTQEKKSEPSSYTPQASENVVITMDEMKAFVDQKTKNKNIRLTILDNRSLPEFSGEVAGKGVSHAGHIPGAKHLHWAETIFSKTDFRFRASQELEELFEARGIKPGDTVIVYCRAGAQASHTYVVAKFLGYKVHLYDGSYIEWSANEAAPIAIG